MSELASGYSGYPASAIRASEEMLTGNFRFAGPQANNNSRPSDISKPLADEPSGTTEASVTHEGEGTNLAQILQLPLPEHIQEDVPDDTDSAPKPATTLDHEYVKKLLRSAEFKNMHEKIAALLSTAWRSTSYIERTLPLEILRYATDNPADWYDENRRRDIESMIAERTGIEQVYDNTEEYTGTPFLRNIEDIREIAWNRGMRDESIRLGLSARLIVLEAVQAWKHASRNT